MVIRPDLSSAAFFLRLVASRQKARQAWLHRPEGSARTSGQGRRRNYAMGHWPSPQLCRGGRGEPGASVSVSCAFACGIRDRSGRFNRQEWRRAASSARRLTHRSGRTVEFGPGRAVSPLQRPGCNQIQTCQPQPKWASSSTRLPSVGFQFWSSTGQSALKLGFFQQGETIKGLPSTAPIAASVRRPAIGQSRRLQIAPRAR